MKTQNRTRTFALALLLFVGCAMAIVWSMVRGYGSVYFFPVFFLVGLGVPFVFELIGGSRRAFRLGLAASALALLAMNFRGHELAGFAPRVLDWSYLYAGAAGLLLAWIVQRVYRHAVPRHGATPRRGAG